MIHPIAIRLLTLFVVLGPALMPAAEPLQPPYSWRGVAGSGVFPAGDLVSDFIDVPEDFPIHLYGPKAKLPKPGTRKNIVWRTTLPHWGHNAPVVVGDKVFLLTEEGWKDDAVQLLCIDVHEGKILWQQPVDHLDAWPEAKAAEGRKWRAQNHELKRRYMTWWNRIFWDNERHRIGHPQMPRSRKDLDLPPDRLLLVEEAAKEGFDVGRWRGSFGGDIKGGIRGRHYFNHPTDEKAAAFKNIYKQCNDNRYYVYPGWASEGPFYGSGMGSVVSDGEFVYAVTAQDAAVCYDLNGKRRWVKDLAGTHVRGPYAAPPGWVQFHMSSPVLGGGKLIYHYRDYTQGHPPFVVGLDAKTGAEAWRTPWPITDNPPGRQKQHGNRPRGYRLHMGPGGTPVIMRLADTLVAVANGGMVVRVADGKALGFVEMPPPGDKKADNPDDSGYGLYSATYNSWTARGDVLYAQRDKVWLFAIRLGVDGDRLTQEVLWRSGDDIKADNRNINLVIAGDKLYGGGWQPKRRSTGFAALDATTGHLELKSGAGIGGYATSAGFGRDKVVWRTGGWGGDSRLGRGVFYTTFHVASVPNLQRLGTGILAVPEPKGDIAERHAAFMGTAGLAFGCGGVTAWGNRIFIRSNDYLWCIGDPKRKWVPPERYLKR